MANNSSSQPKYLQLTEWIKQEILNSQYNQGDKFLSEIALTDKFGYSRQTVRQAMSVLEAEGFIERRRGSGTFVTHKSLPRKLSVQKKTPTKTIGVISTYLDSYIFPSIIRGIDRILSHEGYTMQLCLTHNKVENERNTLQLLMEKGVDGLIVEPTKSGLYNPNVSLYNKISENIPIVFFNSKYPNSKLSQVRMNDRLAGRKATEYLVRMGHRQIAGIFQSDDSQGHRRYAGYVDALGDCKISINSTNVLWFSTEDIPHFEADFARVLRCLESCTAVVCYNDQIAYTLIGALRSRSIRVPDDISVVGIDNAEISAMCEVPITTFSHPKQRLGEAAADSVIQLICGGTFESNIIFEPELVERQSVKRK